MFKQGGIIFDDLNEAPFKRFQHLLPIVEIEQIVTVADALDTHYGPTMTESKRLMCEHLSAAQIGGFYIFNDGSELPV